MQYSLFDSARRNAIPSCSSSTTQLYIREAHGGFVPAGHEDILEAARVVADVEIPRGESLSQPHLVKQLFALKLHSGLEHEIFAMALLDAQYRLIDYLEPFRGTLTQATVYPREVVKMALTANAAAVIIGHNHPSGALQPSSADLTLTRHLDSALKLVDVRLLDHILVADNRTYSFAEHGQL